MQMPSVPGLANVESILRQISTYLGQINTTGGSIDTTLGTIDTAISAINTTLSTAFPAPLTGSVVWDPSSLTTLTQTVTTVTVTGAALGSLVDVSFSLDLQGQTLTAYVSAANTITVVLFNSTAGTLNLASGTIRVRVYQ